MPDNHEPVLVYNRIAANERTTRWLIASFALALLPVLTAGAVFILPWITMIGGAIAYRLYGPSLESKLNALQAQMDASWPANGPLALSDLPTPLLLITSILLVAALAVVLLIFCVAAKFLIESYGARLVLRAAHARRVGPGEEPELVRLVENLCIGAGLPLPNIHLIESRAPNAFATGRDPDHASLVVTRGLLTLLDRRELEGVIAHELSHIGNHDIHLTTTLAALVSLTTIPFRFVCGIFQFAFRVHWSVGVFFLWVALTMCVGFVHLSVGLIGMSQEEGFAEAMPRFLWWWALHAVTAPPYAFFIAPVVGLLIRQAVSRQREFLADADAALLTRDPEGLALALAKIGVAGRERLSVGEGSVHLYFVDPMDHAGSWLHKLFPSHPSLNARIVLLGRMGNGVSPQVLEAARAQAQRSLQAAAVAVSNPPPDPHPKDDGRLKANPATVDPADEEPLTPLYEKPDGWSRVVAQLPPDATVTPIGREGNFVRVVTADNDVGYVAHTAPFSALKTWP